MHDVIPTAAMNDSPQHDWPERIATALTQPPPDSLDLYAGDDRRRLARQRDARTGATRRAAVLIGIVAASEPYIVLTQRGRSLRSHPGQIALPGGGIETRDGSAQMAALREANEEIGLDPACAGLLGQLPRYVTGTGFDIAPFVARIDANATFVADGIEVARIFGLPLDYAMSAANYRRERMHIKGRNHRFYVIEHDGNYVWGATAAILHGLCTYIDTVTAA